VVVVCPGGGYSGRATDHEGKQIVEWLNARGVGAAVLKYRTASESKIDPPLEPGPMLDVQRAIRTVRAKAKDWGVDAKKVGVWGFSAGGHLASTAATHFDKGDEKAKDPIEKESCRPDFAVLAYPVISMKEGVTHGGSRNNLLGKTPDEKKVELYSNELQVTKDTPPTFLFHTAEDKVVLIKNSELFYDALKKAGVEGCKLYTEEKGPHGIGLGQKLKEPSKWPTELEGWMKERGLLKK
jgi:acetyl esterase/lipase